MQIDPTSIDHPSHPGRYLLKNHIRSCALDPSQTNDAPSRSSCLPAYGGRLSKD